MDEEYQAKGRFLDESDVRPTSKQEVVHFISADFLSPAWGKANCRELELFFRQKSNVLKLNKIVAYLDYTGEKGDYISGLDVDPILFTFGASRNQPDEVSIIQVQTTNN